MKIIYDTEKLGLERCQVIGNDGSVHPVGAFWLQVETTDVASGKGRETLNIKRWGTAKQRDAIHKAATQAAD